MPIAARYDLCALRRSLEEIAAIQQHEVMIEYLLLADVNDAPEDAQALVDYLAGLPVHVNLIPFNPIAEAPSFAASPVRWDGLPTALSAVPKFTATSCVSPSKA